MMASPSKGFEDLSGMQGARPNMFFESQLEMPTNSAPQMNPMQSNMMAPNMMNPVQSNMMAPNMMYPAGGNLMNNLLNDIVLLFQRDVLNFTNQNWMGSLQNFFTNFVTNFIKSSTNMHNAGSFVYDSNSQKLSFQGFQFLLTNLRLNLTLQESQQVYQTSGVDPSRDMTFDEFNLFFMRGKTIVQNSNSVPVNPLLTVRLFRGITARMGAMKASIESLYQMYCTDPQAGMGMMPQNSMMMPNPQNNQMMGYSNSMGGFAPLAGKIMTVQGFQKLVMDLGLNDQVLQVESGNIFRLFDRQKNGSLSFEEFNDLIKFNQEIPKLFMPEGGQMTGSYSQPLNQRVESIPRLMQLIEEKISEGRITKWFKKHAE